MKKEITLLSLILLFTTSAAADSIPSYDPIDEASITYADNNTVQISSYSTALFGRLFAAKYDAEGRLETVSSAEIEETAHDGNILSYSYSKLGIDTDITVPDTKLMLWSTYSSDIRPSSNAYTIKVVTPTTGHYTTANNNQTKIVKRIFPSTDDDGNTYYTIVAQSNGGEWRINTNEATLIAKMTEPFNGSREYIADELWRANDENKADITDILHEGDIIGFSNNVIMLMSNADELVNGVLYNNIPSLYNMINWGMSSPRDSFIMGPLQRVEYNNDRTFIFAHDYSMYVENAFVDVITVNDSGEITINTDMDGVIDLIPFDNETLKGDYIYARYNYGQLRELFVYRFE